ncbi:TVP38/TMEM64 family protein [Candidatus Dependentiae bacterium]
MSKTKVTVFIVLVLLIFSFYYFGFGKYFTIANIKENRLLLQQYIENNYAKSVALFMGIYILLTSITLPFAVLLTVVAGFLFGTVWGTLYSNISATIGSSIAFLIVRYLAGNWIHFRFGEKLKNFRKEFKKHGYSYLLSIHFTSVVPLFIINIFAALANVSFWTFFWTTSVGTLPGFFVYAFAGKQFTKISAMKDIFSWKIMIAFLCLALLAMTPIFFKRWMKKRKKKG